MAPSSEKDSDAMDVDMPKKPVASIPKPKMPTTGVNPSASSESASKYPDMGLAQRIHCMEMFLTGNLTAEDAKESGMEVLTATEVMKEISSSEVENPYLYEHLVTAHSLTSTSVEGLLPPTELDAMKSRHETKWAELENAIVDAKENAGDMEILDATLELARFAAKSFSKEKALETYDRVLKLPKLSSGKTIDALMEAARVASFWNDFPKASEFVDRAQGLSAKGGDWDRRNRLKVYSAVGQIVRRDFKASSELLLDCIATFSCTELCPYSEFVVYTILTNILHISRTTLKKQLIDGPEILSVKNDLPIVYRLVSSLHDCDYKAYLHAMVELRPVLVRDRFLQRHAGYLLRELNVLGYKQFLDSYKSVTLANMAQSFGISTDYLDLQLSRFIAAGRLAAKIDKFGGVVETNRPDKKNAQYRDMISKGDALLNRIQKLTRVLDV